MSDRAFLDTNIFVYSFDGSAPQKAKVAKRLIAEALQRGSGLISYQVVQEFLNVAMKRFTPVFSADDGERYFLTVFRPLLAVHSSPVLYQQALRFKERYRLAWYDSLIVAGAVESGCQTLFTEDLQHGMKVEGLEVKNPFLLS